MAQRNTICHFMHWEHPLNVELESPKQFICNGCKMLGTGKRFQCAPCNFHLHQHCAKCPMTLSSFLHPAHQLVLFVPSPPGPRQMNLSCNVCGEQVEGLFYRCQTCNFDVHPGCTRLPQQVRHVMHPQHPLALQALPSGSCMVCRDTVNGWGYRCNQCSVDIHFPCLLVQYQGSTSASASSRGIQHRPSYYAPPPPAYNHQLGHYYCYHYYNNGYYPFHGPHMGGSGGGSSGPSWGVSNVGNGIGVSRLMYGIVGRLMQGAFMNAIFGGQDFSLFFSEAESS